MKTARKERSSWALGFRGLSHGPETLPHFMVTRELRGRQGLWTRSSYQRLTVTYFPAGPYLLKFVPLLKMVPPAWSASSTRHRRVIGTFHIQTITHAKDIV